MSDPVVVGHIAYRWCPHHGETWGAAAEKACEQCKDQGHGPGMVVKVYDEKEERR